MATCLHGDCLELMKTLPSKSVDLFICDLPYGCLTSAKEATKKRFVNGEDTGTSLIIYPSGCAWDIKIDLNAFWIEVKRLCKNNNTPVLMFCNTLFGIDLINSNREWFRYDLVWNKAFGTNFLLANKMPMKSHEMIYVFSKKRAFYNRIDQVVEGKEAYKPVGGYIDKCKTFGNGLFKTKVSKDDNTRCPLSVINFPRYKSKLHPTCKSIDLYKWLIERYSNEGDMVLDPTAGSFNSGRACIELNRNYIGIELDDKFYNENKLDA